MKRLIFLSASIIMFCTLNCFADTIVEKIGDLNTQTILDPGGYRNAKWGMTKEAVKLAINDVKWEELTLKLETNKKWAKFFNKVDSIRYEDKMFDHPTIVLFDFDSNEKLKEVTLAVKPKDGGYFNSIELNEVWNSLVKILEDKYGKLTEVKNSLDKPLVGGTSANEAWQELINLYNPLCGEITGWLPITTVTLDTFATNKGLDGLFLKISDEEKSIRKDPAARVNDILKRVFGELD